MDNFRRMFRKVITASFSLVLLVGCDAFSPTQTAELTSASQAEQQGDIYRMQAENNFGMAINDPSFIPSQITIRQGVGSGSTVYQPSLSTELKYGIMTKNSIS